MRLSRKITLIALLLILAGVLFWQNTRLEGAESGSFLGIEIKPWEVETFQSVLVVVSVIVAILAVCVFAFAPMKVSDPEGHDFS